MCLANLIIIKPTPSPDVQYPRTIGKQDTITYSHDQLTYLSKSQHCKNLMGLPPGSIGRIRDLQLNKKKIKMRQKKAGTINRANFRNLRQVDTTNEVNQHVIEKFRFATVNTRSVKPKEDMILEALNEHQIDLLVTTETWLRDTDDDQQWLLGSELNRNGFQTVPVNRKNKKGGGLALTIKDNIKVSHENSAEYKSFEHAIWNISHKTMPTFTVVAIYHPPSTCQDSTDATFIDQFTDLLTTLQAKYNNIIILGDINMHMDDPNNQNACKLQDSINAFDLTQHVKIPTHNKGHTLDVIITTKSTGFNNVDEIIPGPYISDHRLLILETTIDKIKPKRVSTKARKSVKNINNIFKEKYNDNEILNSATLEDALNQFTKEVLKTLDEIAPQKIVKAANRKPKPWYDDDLKQQRTIMKNRERKWIKHHEDHHWKAYMREQNRYNTMLKFKKNDCLYRIIKANSNNTKKLFKLISEITGNSKPNPMPDAQSNEELAEGFAKFFRQKIDGIRYQFKDIPQYKIPPRDTPTLRSFAATTENNLLKLIREMPTKTCDSDIIPTKLLKEILPTIIPALTKITNLSINNGEFSEKWKSATVKPLIKSLSKGTTHQNYRPVSNLTFISKVVEKITLNQFTLHCENNNLLPDYQSAYRKYHSCETSLIKLVNDLLWTMEKQEVTAMTLLDLSAAFDTVDHDLLLEVLNKRFGVKEKALKWYEQYLKPRKFKVAVNNTHSKEQTIDYSMYPRDPFREHFCSIPMPQQ